VWSASTVHLVRKRFIILIKPAANFMISVALLGKSSIQSVENRLKTDTCPDAECSHEESV
jgi:hypothetical protein